MTPKRRKARFVKEGKVESKSTKLTMAEAEALINDPDSYVAREIVVLNYDVFKSCIGAGMAKDQIYANIKAFYQSVDDADKWHFQTISGYVFQK